MTRRVLVVLSALVVMTAVPQAARAASSLTVAVSPPIAGATPTVTFTMASDDPTAGVARGFLRADDGRPCEATFLAFASVPGSVLLGSAPFAPGVTALSAPRLTQSGSFRICGYLTGASNSVTLALDDRVIPVRLPAGSAVVTLDPPIPAFSRPVSMRLAGNVDIPSVLDVALTTGGCSEEATVASAPLQFLDPGAFDVTIPDLLLRQDVTYLCLAIRPQTELAPPNQTHRLTSVERPVDQDLGGTIADFQVRRVGRALEVSAQVSGAFRIAPKINVAIPQGVRITGDICDTPSFRERPTDILTIRGGIATGACLLDYEEARKLPRFDVSLFGVTTLGAHIETPIISLDANEYRRTGRLVVPEQSIGFVRLGMTLDELVHQGGRRSDFQFRHPAPEKLILPGGRSRSLYGVDNVLVLVRGGRVRGMATNWPLDFAAGSAFHRTANGLTLMTASGRPGLRRKAPGARCRPHPRNRAITDLCRIGPTTYWGARSRTGLPGFLAIWPGARVRPPSARFLP
jgi:hypothetical protein